MYKNRKLHFVSSFALIGLWLTALPINGFADTQLSDSLQQSLKAQGWQKSKADDGSVIYSQSTSQPKPAVETVRVTQDRKKLGETLHQSGWQADWNEDGSLVLKPRPQIAASSSGSKVKDQPIKASPLPDLSKFEYWRVIKGKDGTMSFHPVADVEMTKADSRSSSHAKQQQCEQQKTETQTVLLPVDQWEEVNEIARGWLQKSGVEGLRVGHSRPFRRSEWFYLVNLVNDFPPYALQFQIAIRATDGQVVLMK